VSNSVPNLRKTWEFDVNQIIPGDTTITNEVQLDKRQLLFQIKESLVNGTAANFSTPWTVQQSSNGDASAGASDFWAASSDIRWGTDAADPNTVARSWIVLHNAALGVYWLIDCTHSTSGERGNEMDMWMATTAYNVDGTLTARPTAGGDELQLADRLTSAEGSWEGNSSSNIARTYVLHVMMSDDGEETRVIITYLGKCTAAWSIGKPVGALGSPTHDWYASVSPKLDNSTQVCTRFYWNESPTDKWHSMKNDGGQVDAVIRASRSDQFSDEWSDGYGLVPGAFDGRWPLMEFVLESDTIGWQMTMGIVPDMYWGPINQPHAKTWPGARDFIQFGDTIWPWNGSIPIPSF
jgi:hypothetical protein